MPQRERNNPGPPAEQAAGDPRLANPDLQQLWFQVQRREWSSLVVVPADGDFVADAIATQLWRVGCALSASPPELLNCERMAQSAIAELVVRLSRARGSPRDINQRRIVVSIGSVLSNPLGIGVARAADAVLLCVRKQRTKLAAARATVELIGRECFIGSVVLSRPKAGSIVL